MNFEHSFFIALPPTKAWPLLLDVERLAPCVPGAQLQEAAGNEYRGVVKVKLGPITAQYKGTVTLDEADEAARRMVMTAKARDVHGQGNANATIIALMTPDPSGSRIALSTDLQISGKVAQLGKGVMQDVSEKLIQQFAQALQRQIASAPGQTEVLGAVATDSSAPRTIEGPEAAPVDLLALGKSALGKRVAAAAAIVLGTIAFLRWRRNRK